MSDSTPRLGLPDLPDTPELYAETVSDAFWRLDALTDLCLKGRFADTPPSAPADGEAWLLGASPTGAWSGQAYKIAACRDGGWQFLTPFDGLRAWVEDDGCFIVCQDGNWTDWNSLIGADEDSIASAATCDIGAAGSLFLQVTGTTAIASFGAAANRLRFLRFAASLTLTHDATALVLPGGANIVTAAGDCALFASDSGGNWRCRHYQKASGQPVAAALSIASLAAAGAVQTGQLATGGHAVGAAGRHVLYNNTAADAGNAIVDIQGNTDGMLQIIAVSGLGYNNANCAVFVGKDNSTGRSINAGGTVNASGADYAEYEVKAEDCGLLAKGQVVGFDEDGRLTDRWAAAVSFGIKSSDPCLVGGDRYGAGLSRGDPDFAARLEAARARVDRIAYAGKVPVNVTGARPGDVIVAAAAGEAIGGIAVAVPDAAQARRVLGRVRRILPDGRAEVVVLVS